MATVTVFSVEDTSALLDAAREARVVPVDGPQGWSLSEADPEQLIAAFGSLRLRPGWALGAYQYRKGPHGNAIVWAVPAGLPLPGPDGCPRLEGVPLAPPRPPGSLPNPMQAIEGDGSPHSYLEASLLARELAEFGALGRGVAWGAHVVVDALPGGDAWRWRRSRPTEWRPLVELTGEGATVVFHTVSLLGREGIYQHLDTYPPGSYVADGQSTAIAVGGAGYLP